MARGVAATSTHTQPRPVGTSDSAPWTPGWARDLVCEVLSELPCRKAHSLRAGVQATRVMRTVAAVDAQLLVTAALLHDIGYAPALHRTGFHPLDGAVFLLDLGASERLAGLVAHHSGARLLARPRGLLDELARFPDERSPVADALIYADMTAGPCGIPMTVTDRLADIEKRHAHEPHALRSARFARRPFLRAAVERVHQRSTEPGLGV